MVYLSIIPKTALRSRHLHFCLSTNVRYRVNLHEVTGPKRPTSSVTSNSVDAEEEGNQKSQNQVPANPLYPLRTATNRQNDTGRLSRIQPTISCNSIRHIMTRILSVVPLQATYIMYRPCYLMHSSPFRSIHS